MTSPDNFFEPLYNHREDPSSRVWKSIEADQNLKRRKRASLLWWGSALTALTLFSFWMLRDTPPPHQVKPGPMGMSQVQNGKSHLAASPAVSGSQGSASMVQQSSDINLETSKHIYLSAQTTTGAPFRREKYTKTNEIAPAEDPDELLIPKNNPLPTSTDQIIVSAAPLDEKIAPPQKDSILGGLAILPKKKNRPQEKLPRKKFFEAQLMMARTFRKLGHGSADMETYRNLRNNSEIASTQPGLQLNAGVYINSHWSIQSGLLFMPQKLTSSYTWQQMKTNLVIDSMRTRTVFDSTTMQWVSTTDTFSHTVTSRQQMNNNSDQSFYYIKLPVFAQYEVTVRKMIYYIAAGASLNILILSKGSIRDYNSGAGQMPLNSAMTRFIGMDIMTRIGTRFPIGKTTELSMGFKGGFSPINVFQKNYPLPQYHMWYGVEVGLRKLLF